MLAVSQSFAHVTVNFEKRFHVRKYISNACSCHKITHNAKDGTGKKISESEVIEES